MYPKYIHHCLEGFLTMFFLQEGLENDRISCSRALVLFHRSWETFFFLEYTMRFSKVNMC